MMTVISISLASKLVTRQHGANVLKNVNYYVMLTNSHVCTRFVNLSKALNSVDCWKLFNFLVDDNVSVNICVTPSVFV